MSKGKIKRIIKLLTAEYGNREWRTDEGPLLVLVQTILSQNTSDRNSGRAFDALLATFDDWEKMADASTSEIADSIKIGGLGEVKARYIKQALEEIRQRRGNLSLDFLRQLPLEEARDWLKQLPGVGTKTASCVLLFSLGMPALPVDTHVFRVVKRLGLVDAKASVEKAHQQLESLVSPKDVYKFHVLVIEHGRKVCKAQHPRCDLCVLCKLCPSCGLRHLD
jgi:endonuclease-3